MDNKLEALKSTVKASLQCVDSSFFNLQTTYEPSGIVRERVFCYELYHQMRRNITRSTGFPLSLNGEIDKRGHVDFEKKDRKNPDFVFHIPGEHEGNTVVIEVKGRLKRQKVAIEKDFKTLITFVQKYRYQLGLFILYNHTALELKEKINPTIDAHLNDLKKIHILCMKEAQAEIEDIPLHKFLQN